MPTPTSRLPGLDSLRAAAIVLVFCYHYQVFVSGEASFGLLSQIGWSGVDLFFVLSGYLIGSQVMSGLADPRGFHWTTFYARRLLRTLPAYYVVLALFFLFPAEMGGKTPPPLWTFLTFTQNIGLQVGTAFSHAWSLCVEEQFYLLLPLLAALTRWGHRPLAAWISLITLMLAGVLIRTLLWQRYGGGDFVDYYAHIYYATPARFDELLPGVALAILRQHHPMAWEALMRRGGLLLLLGLGLAAAANMLFLQHHELAQGGYVGFTTIFGYPLLALGYAGLTAAALSPATWLGRWRLPGAAQLAAWSYAIYLTHKPIGMALRKPLTAWGLPLSSPASLLLVGGISVLGGVVLYRLVEKPALQLRERYFPMRREPAPPSPGAANQLAQHA